MDVNRAIDLLKQALTEVEHLRTLSLNNEEFDLWHHKVCDILETTFGKDSTEYDRFIRAVNVHFFTHTEAERQEEYNRRLNEYETALKSIVQKYELLGIETKPTAMAEPPKAFIVHGGKSKARDKLCRFLTALAVIPFIIEEEPKEGRSVNEQVEYYSKLADCAIILGTADDKELKDGKLYPRRNDYIEIGRFQEKFSNTIIYLLEEGASFPSIISEKLYTRFTQENMDEGFIAVVRELTAFGMLKAEKP